MVEDEGPGIPAENLERIFERFYTDRPQESFGQNSGLGLNISRQIVGAHGGRLLHLLHRHVDDLKLRVRHHDTVTARVARGFDVRTLRRRPVLVVTDREEGAVLEQLGAAAGDRHQAGGLEAADDVVEAHALLAGDELDLGRREGVDVDGGVLAADVAEELLVPLDR